jgi:O-antigen ligase
MRRGDQVLLAALALLLVFALVGGEQRLVWIGSAAVLAAAAALGASFLGLLPRPVLGRFGVLAVTLFAAFAAWVGLSIFWSAAPDRTWDYLNRSLIYLGFLALGLLAGRRWLGQLLAGLLGLVLVWALVVKVFALDDGRRARLHEPVGYWNTLGLLAATAIPLALALRWVLPRALLVYAAVVVVLLTQSRGALALAVAGTVAWLWLEPERRREAGWSLLAAAPPGVVVGAFVLSLSGIADDGQPHSERLSAGLLLGAALIVGALVAVVVARLEVRPDVLRYAVYAVVPLGLAAAVFVGVRAVQDFDEPVTPESPVRLAQGSSNNRAQWWHEAWDGFVDNPVAGNGAGAFQVTHRRYRESNVEVREPHSLPLQLLTETGVVGFLLFAGFGVAAALAVRGRETELVLVPALFLAGALFDIHWDFVAAGALVFVTLGALLKEGERPGAHEPLLAAGMAALALACVYSIAAPWLAERRVDDAFAALTRGDFSTALEKTRQARALDPLSVEPLLARGYIEEARGQFDAARDAYATATDVQPENREAWFRLGSVEYDNERYQDAYVRFNRMYALDPHGPHVLWVRRAQCKIDRSVECPPAP